MRKNLLFLGSIALAILLLGAGCNKKADNISDNQVTSRPTDELTQNTTPTIDITEQKSGGFNLSVEAKENKTVYVKFDVPDDLKKSAEGYRIVMGREENPTKENATNWYQLEKNHLDKMWTGMPNGTRHFRVCVMNNNACSMYSNDVVVDIK